jgi:thiosulfate reductase cytochrome b subunit
MDLPRKIGIGIVMIVPTFVGSGALWHIFHSFIPVIIWVILMGFVTKGIVTGKIASRFQSANS